MTSMACFTCRSSSFRSISRAMAKAAGAKLRQVGALRTSTDWTTRAVVCENCALRVIHSNVSYCGKPFLRQVDRDPALDGCGCPTRDKAKSPSEHCPINRSYNAAQTREDPGDDTCDCKWCMATSARG